MFQGHIRKAAQAQNYHKVSGQRFDGCYSSGTWQHHNVDMGQPISFDLRDHSSTRYLKMRFSDISANQFSAAVASRDSTYANPDPNNLSARWEFSDWKWDCRTRRSCFGLHLKKVSWRGRLTKRQDDTDLVSEPNRVWQHWQASE